MTLTAEQMKKNEEHFLFAIRVSKSYTWADHGETFDIKDNKMFAQTERGYLLLGKIVSKDFMFLYAQPPANTTRDLWEILYPTALKKEVFRCAICGNDMYAVKYPIGPFDFKGEGTCGKCYTEIVRPCEEEPEKYQPIYSPMGVGLREGEVGKRRLILNERAYYKVNIVCPIQDTRPLEKVLNEYNTELETMAKEVGFKIPEGEDDFAEEKVLDLIGEWLKRLVDTLVPKFNNGEKLGRLDITPKWRETKIKKLIKLFYEIYPSTSAEADL